MGLLDRIRRPRASAGSAADTFSPDTFGPDWTRRLPQPVLTRIFVFVCPHAADSSYDSSEESMTDDCMLCDMRDLAHCALVCKRWFLEARALLYVSQFYIPAFDLTFSKLYQCPHRSRALL